MAPLRPESSAGGRSCLSSQQLNLQEGERIVPKGPLGLKLTITPHFIDEVQKALDKAAAEKKNTSCASTSGVLAKIEDSQPMSAMLKTSKFPAKLLKIGAWERHSTNGEDLRAKFYYEKRKMVWEILEGTLKNRIEIVWNDILAIRSATDSESQLGILEIELNHPPSFFWKLPRERTIWYSASDFTGGEALKCRRHYVTFSSGLLDVHFLKLLLSDSRILELSRKSFPQMESPYFYLATSGINDNVNPRPILRIPPSSHYSHLPVHPPTLVSPFPLHNLEPASMQLDATLDSNSHVSDLSRGDQNPNSYTFGNQNTENWSTLPESTMSCFYGGGNQIRPMPPSIVSRTQAAMNPRFPRLGDQYQAQPSFSSLTQTWARCPYQEDQSQATIRPSSVSYPVQAFTPSLSSSAGFSCLGNKTHACRTPSPISSVTLGNDGFACQKNQIYTGALLSPSPLRQGNDGFFGQGCQPPNSAIHALMTASSISSMTQAVAGFSCQGCQIPGYTIQDPLSEILKNVENHLFDDSELNILMLDEVFTPSLPVEVSEENQLFDMLAQSDEYAFSDQKKDDHEAGK
ncbi:hypothetical protein NMG60_11020884 [Bertholletia excelsa]